MCEYGLRWWAGSTGLIFGIDFWDRVFILHKSSYKRVKGRSHTAEKRFSMHPHKPHATTRRCTEKARRYKEDWSIPRCNCNLARFFFVTTIYKYKCTYCWAGWLHGVFVGDWLFVFPLCGFSLSLFCNYVQLGSTPYYALVKRRPADRSVSRVLVT